MSSNPLSTLGRVGRQYWRDLLSVYYANTPVWRWLKSAALVFLGFFAWMGGSVLLSVQPGWTFLHYVMAYGMLVVAWGPFTHFVVVPLTIRLRRTADHPVTRAFSRNSGTINLTIFFALVVVLGTVTPGFMLLEFSLSSDGGTDVTGDLSCEVGETVVTCEITDPSGFDRVVVTSGGETIVTVDEPPYTFEFEQDVLVETRTGREYRVSLQDENGDRVRRFVRIVPG
ncbi:hypothetical protein [Halovenus marina]|uniref:hypothetical protein n=1 Tax=Halovenus marina TaxID=3396621 RepID=UPI003F5458F4